MRVIVFGTYDASVHPRVAVLAEGLSDHGREIITCNAPLGIRTAGRVAMLRQTWRLPLLAFRILRAWMTLVLRALRLPSADAVLVGYMGHFDVRLARMLFPRTPIVLDHLIGARDTALDRGESHRLKLALLRRLDSSALAAADIVVVDTEEHRGLLDEQAAAKTVVVPVGAEMAWFTAGEGRMTAQDGRPLTVVFFGLFTPLQGSIVIGNALGLLRGSPIEVTMIGEGQDYAAARAAAEANQAVRWLPWVEAASLPEVVARHDVCLGIFGTTSKALRVVPNKVYQGAAVGCAVVTSDTAPQRRALGDAALFVPPGDHEALARTLLALAADRGSTRALGSAAKHRALSEFSPREVVRPLLSQIDAALGRHDR